MRWIAARPWCDGNIGMIGIGAFASEPLDVTLCPSMETCRLPQRLVETLVAQGHAFVLTR